MPPCFRRPPIQLGEEGGGGGSLQGDAVGGGGGLPPACQVDQCALGIGNPVLSQLFPNSS